MFSGRKEMSLGDAIRALLRTNGMEEKLEETRLLEGWDRMMGQHISQHTISKRVSKSILYIKLDSAALRHELGYRRQEIKNALNHSVGKSVIKDIVFS